MNLPPIIGLVGGGPLGGGVPITGLGGGPPIRMVQAKDFVLERMKKVALADRIILCISWTVP